MSGRDERGRSTRVVGALVSLGVISSLLAVVGPGAGALQTAQPAIVSADPADFTPHILDGKVEAIAQVGNTIFLGGLFTQAREDNRQAILSRNNILAFDAATGAILPWAPVVNGEVTAIVAAPDGASIYIGGFFTRTNGSFHRSVARLSTSTGANVRGFRSPKLAGGRVRDLRLSAGRLWVAGDFTSVAGSPQALLATLDAGTALVDPFMSLPFAGVHDTASRNSGGKPAVVKIDITPDGSRLLGVGNFKTVDGQDRDQIFQLDLTGPSATLATWQTNTYKAICSASFNTYIRDIDYSPDGSFFVVTSTGAYRGATSACDTIARFETLAEATGRLPTWQTHTGGDTTYAVAVAGEAVYAGGHMRWVNNPFAGDRAGQGAIAREGIVALESASGLPYSWNPGRTRGVGVFDLLATSEGLWMGSDTDRTGTPSEFHSRIAFFPLAGGTTVTIPDAGHLPGQVLLARTDVVSGTNGDLLTRQYDGATVGPTSTIPTPAGWNTTRGAVMINGVLYTGQADGAFVKRTFDGEGFGPATPVDLSDRIVAHTNWHNEVPNITGLFYDRGRLYYTLAGQTSLYHRPFNPESDAVGAQRYTASASVAGISFSTVTGMFLSGNLLYWATSDGNLRRIGFADGLPLGGTAQLVSGPALDGANWYARDLFVYAGPAGAAPNRAPQVSMDVTCSGADCTGTSAGTFDPDGTVASYAWAFGDGATATGPSASHAYTQSGTYSVTLTVTDDDGASTEATRTVTVTAPNQVPVASFTLSCLHLSCSVDGTASSDADGTIASHGWDFGDGETATGATASHDYAAGGSQTITLTVTDDRGGATETSRTFNLAAPAAQIGFVGEATSNANTATHSVVVPTAVASGDGLVLMMTTNTVTTVPDPTGVVGWQPVDTLDTAATTTRVWRKVAGVDDAGSRLRISLPQTSKANLVLLAYRGTSTTDPVAGFARATETTATLTHRTPTAAVSTPGGWAVSYWSHRDSATDVLEPPAGVEVRSSGSQTGGGRVTGLAVDSGAVVTQPLYGDLSATAAATSRNATMWTIVLAPAT